MKKTILLVGLITIFAIQSCDKESLKPQNITSSLESNTNSSTKRKMKVNVVHNGHTININENALLTHLNHGDKVGTVEDNVLFQGILVDEQILGIDNPLLNLFKNTSDVINYNEEMFGELDFQKAVLGTYLSGNQVIYIPIKESRSNSIKKGLVGYVSEDKSSFFSVVLETELKVDDVMNLDELKFESNSGRFSFYEPKGELLISITLEKNKIVDFIINDGTTPQVSCFANCYKASRNACADSFPCSLACAAIAEIPCIVGTALCCAGNCGFGTSEPC